MASATGWTRAQAWVRACFRNMVLVAGSAGFGFARGEKRPRDGDSILSVASVVSRLVTLSAYNKDHFSGPISLFWSHTVELDPQ
jgi:hypothetical protein